MDFGSKLDAPEGPSHDHLLAVSVSPMNGPIPTGEEHQQHGHDDSKNKTEAVPVASSTVVGIMPQVAQHGNAPNNKQGPLPPFIMPMFNANSFPVNGFNPMLQLFAYPGGGSHPVMMTLASSSGTPVESNAAAASSAPSQTWPPQGVLTLVPAGVSNGSMPPGGGGVIPMMSPQKRMAKNGTPGSKDRIFPCMNPGCNCSFSTRFSLKRHQKKHSGDRPYVCNHINSVDGQGKQCARRFAEMSTLKRHMRTHTGERPYKCDFPNCDKSFADRTNVRRHRQTHDQSKRFACPGDNCNRTFARRGFLSKHLESEHSSLPQAVASLAAALMGGEEEDEDTSDDTASGVGSPKSTHNAQQVSAQLPSMPGMQLPMNPQGPA